MGEPKDSDGPGDPPDPEEPSHKTLGARPSARSPGVRSPQPESAPEAASPPSSDSSERDPRVGTSFGKYRILRVLGRGGMGAVYEAEDSVIGRRVAIKFLPEDLLKAPAALKRFQGEAQAAGRLNHPHVVAIYDTVFDGTAPFIVMELLRPGSAASFIGKLGALHWAEATRIVADCANALEAAHQARLVHRDVKPDNILCSRNGDAKLVDFGLAKEVFHDSGTTQPGMQLGTPDFMSPEQVKLGTVDARSDIYSLGATYYALLAGEPPFSTGGSTQIMYAHVHDPLPDPRKKAAMPDACVDILRRATAKDPAERYQSAFDMLADLEHLLLDAPEIEPRFLVAESSSVTWGGEGSPGSATPPRSKPGSNRGSRSRTRQRSHTRLYAELGVLLAVIVGAAWLTISAQRPVEPSNQGSAIPPVAAGPPIPVGILHSMSGTMAFSERPVVDATLLAIREINEHGGVLGRRIDPVIADGRSDWPTFAKEAERLITNEKVVTLFGGWTSASRKSMRPVVERLDHLLMYPVQYEGLEDSLNIIYLGAAPNQQVIPATDWCVQKLKREKLFLVGSDYVFPRAANAIIRDEAKRLGATVVGEEYLLLGDTDVAGIIKKITASSPDMILNTINGDSNIAFFRALRAAGYTPAKLPTMSFSIGEGELQQMHGIELVGDYAAWNYFQSVDRAQNHAFEARFHAVYGADRVINDPMEAAYDGVHLWAQAVRAAGSTDVRAIRQAIKGQRYNAPGAEIRIDPSNNHTWKPFRVGRILSGNRFEVIADSKELIPPMPFPDLRTRTEWESMLDGLYEGWHGNWANPARPRFAK
jgi:urea transport system substrate-binding protein